jgi:PEP-CTERM motif
MCLKVQQNNLGTTLASWGSLSKWGDTDMKVRILLFSSIAAFILSNAAAQATPLVSDKVSSESVNTDEVVTPIRIGTKEEVLVANPRFGLETWSLADLGLREPQAQAVRNLLSAPKHIESQTTARVNDLPLDWKASTIENEFVVSESEDATGRAFATSQTVPGVIRTYNWIQGGGEPDGVPETIWSGAAGSFSDTLDVGFPEITVPAGERLPIRVQMITDGNFTNSLTEGTLSLNLRLLMLFEGDPINFEGCRSELASVIVDVAAGLYGCARQIDNLIGGTNVADLTLELGFSAASEVQMLFVLIATLDAMQPNGTVEFANNFSTLVANIEVDPRLTISSATGAIVEKEGGGFGYQAALDVLEDRNPVTRVPEPHIAALFGLGLVGAAFARRRQKAIRL